MRVHYLEVVTKDVEASCALYEKMHGAQFGDADPSLGGARTASLSNGGMMGVRPPMHEVEEEVIRPYLAVEDIAAAVALAVGGGAEVAFPPTTLSPHGVFAIVIHGATHHGLWQKALV